MSHLAGVGVHGDGSHPATPRDVVASIEEVVKPLDRVLPIRYDKFGLPNAGKSEKIQVSGASKYVSTSSRGLYAYATATHY